MNLRKKKKLASEVLGVGIKKIKFNEDRLEEIKEAITKQDIKDLVKTKAIIIARNKGRRNIVKKKRRGPGKIKKKINTRKKDYINLTRKLRNYLNELKKQGKLKNQDLNSMRKMIRNKVFKSKANLQEYLEGEKKWE